jgi:hypothetical protein
MSDHQAAAPFTAGARVVIRQQRGHGFLMPMRKWAAEGRKGTVKSCVFPHGGREFLVTVQFDTKRSPKWPDNFVLRLGPDDLQLVATP